MTRKKLRIDIATLFPDMCESVLSESIVGRARKANLVSVNCYNIRDFSTDKHKKVDDKPYGGGTGMVMSVQPVYDCIKHILDESSGSSRVIYLSPKGKVLTQDMVNSLAQAEHLILLCGHYEGVDQRVLDELGCEEISIGDYVMTGGELAALVLTDSVVRVLPDVLPDEAAFSDESHYHGLLEQPHYTRPEIWKGKKVPQVLISGNHAKIKKWQNKQKLLQTMQKRPDIYQKYIKKRNAMKTIGVIGAMPSELSYFRDSLKDAVIKKLAGYDFYISESYGCKLITVCCGIGKVNAAICTQILIDEFNVGAIINTGVAGGIAEATKVFDIVISKDVMHHDLLTRFLTNYPPYNGIFKADQTLVDIAATSCTNLGENFFIKRIVSGEIFVSDSITRDKIIEEFDPYAVDMETAAIAQAAYRNEIPFVSVRCISDKADEESDISFDEFSEKAAVKVAKIVINMIKRLGKTID